MQIDLPSLTLEQWLLVLLLGYVLSFALLGLVKGRKYLRSYPTVEAKDNYLLHSFDVRLTLAGLSITSLALFIGLGLTNLERLSSIILFFSISFVAFVVAADFGRFHKGFYIFTGEVLEKLGILAIGCGFFVFFTEELPLSKELILTYGFFIAIFVLLSCLDLHKYWRYWSSFGISSSKQTTKEVT